MPAEYYNNILYPLQDRAIKVFRNTLFYLTGGTTLSRGYYNHRFSDDLDYFVNYLPDFQILAETQVKKLQGIFPLIEIDYKGEYFYRIFVADRQLKIELVNDVPAYIGNKITHPLLGIIDSKENILANKITAIVDRCMPKDIVDMYFLLKDGIDLKQSFLDAHSKAAGISPLFVAKIINEFDYSLLDTEIKWVTAINSNIIKDYLTNISLSIIKGTL